MEASQHRQAIEHEISCQEHPSLGPAAQRPSATRTDGWVDGHSKLNPKTGQAWLDQLQAAHQEGTVVDFDKALTRILGLVRDTIYYCYDSL